MNGGGFNLSKMPKSVTCYICGRGYGTKSISIHLKTCEKKWDIEQKKKPKKERRPCPQPPQNFMNVIKKDKISHKDLEQLNNKAFEEYNEISLERCQICNRTFNPESFKIHQRICTVDNPFRSAKPVNKEKQPRVVFKKKTVVDNKAQIEKPSLKMKNLYSFNPKLEEQNFIKKVEMAPVKEIKKQNPKKKENKTVSKIKENEGEKKAKWKNQSQNLQETMKYMRKLKQMEDRGEDISKLKAPKCLETPNDLEQCPYCERSFNEKALERHAKICANVVNKPTPLRRKDQNKKMKL